MKYEVILFDADETLFDFKKSEREAFRKAMIDMGIDTFVEIGPGKTLSGFVKRTNKDVKILNINDVESLESVIEGLKVEK